MSDKPTLDTDLLMAADQACTGANVHRIVGARADYVGWFQLGQPEGIAGAKKRLQDLLIQIEREKVGQ